MTMTDNMRTSKLICEKLVQEFHISLERIDVPEASIPFVDHKILEEHEDIINFKSDINGAVHSLILRWQTFEEKYPYFVKEKKDTFWKLIRMTGKIVFQGKFIKEVAEETKATLKRIVVASGFKFENGDPEMLICLSLCEVIDAPWASYMSIPSSPSERMERIQTIWRDECYILLEERLDVLITQKILLDPMAFILEIFVTMGLDWQRKTRHRTQDFTNGESEEFHFDYEKLLQYGKLYALLAHQSPDKYKAADSWDVHFLQDVSTSLFKETREDSDRRLFPKLKQWKIVGQIATDFLKSSLWIALKRPNCDLCSLASLLEVVIHHHLEANNSEETVIDTILVRKSEVFCSQYLFTLADVIKKKQSSLPPESIRVKFIEAYVCAIMLAINHIEEKSSAENINTEEILKWLKELSSKYLDMAEMFKEHRYTTFQLLLTAHSLHPQMSLYDKLFPEADGESISTVDHTLWESAETLGFPEHLYLDFQSAVCSPRVKSICSWTSMEDLKIICRDLVETGIRKFFTNCELMYVNVDFETFPDTRPLEENFEDNGVEKGYECDEDDDRWNEEEDEDSQHSQQSYGAKISDNEEIEQPQVKRKRGRPPGPSKKNKAIVPKQVSKKAPARKNAAEGENMKNVPKRGRKPGPKKVMREERKITLMDRSLRRLQRVIKRKERKLMVIKQALGRRRTEKINYKKGKTAKTKAFSENVKDSEVIKDLVGKNIKALKSASNLISKSVNNNENGRYLQNGSIDNDNIINVNEMPNNIVPLNNTDVHNLEELAADSSSKRIGQDVVPIENEEYSRTELNNSDEPVVEGEANQNVVLEDTEVETVTNKGESALILENKLPVEDGVSIQTESCINHLGQNLTDTRKEKYDGINEIVGEVHVDQVKEIELISDGIDNDLPETPNNKENFVELEPDSTPLVEEVKNNESESENTNQNIVEDIMNENKCDEIMNNECLDVENSCESLNEPLKDREDIRIDLENINEVDSEDIESDVGISEANGEEIGNDKEDGDGLNLDIGNDNVYGHNMDTEREDCIISNVNLNPMENGELQGKCAIIQKKINLEYFIEIENSETTSCNLDISTCTSTVSSKINEDSVNTNDPEPQPVVENNTELQSGIETNEEEVVQNSNVEEQTIPMNSAEALEAFDQALDPTSENDRCSDSSLYSDTSTIFSENSNNLEDDADVIIDCEIKVPSKIDESKKARFRVSSKCHTKQIKEKLVRIAPEIRCPEEPEIITIDSDSDSEESVVKNKNSNSFSKGGCKDVENIQEKEVEPEVSTSTDFQQYNLDARQHFNDLQDMEREDVGVLLEDVPFVSSVVTESYYPRITNQDESTVNDDLLNNLQDHTYTDEETVRARNARNDEAMTDLMYRHYFENMDSNEASVNSEEILSLANDYSQVTENSDEVEITCSGIDIVDPPSHTEEIERQLESNFGVANAIINDLEGNQVESLFLSTDKDESILGLPNGEFSNPSSPIDIQDINITHQSNIESYCGRSLIMPGSGRIDISHNISETGGIDSRYVIEDVQEVTGIEIEGLTGSQSLTLGESPYITLSVANEIAGTPMTTNHYINVPLSTVENVLSNAVDEIAPVNHIIHATEYDDVVSVEIVSEVENGDEVEVAGEVEVGNEIEVENEVQVAYQVQVGNQIHVGDRWPRTNKWINVSIPLQRMSEDFIKRHITERNCAEPMNSTTVQLPAKMSPRAPQTRNRNLRLKEPVQPPPEIMDTAGFKTRSSRVRRIQKKTVTIDPETNVPAPKNTVSTNDLDPDSETFEIAKRPRRFLPGFKIPKKGQPSGKPVLHGSKSKSPLDYWQNDSATKRSSKSSGRPKRTSKHSADDEGSPSKLQVLDVPLL